MIFLLGAVTALLLGIKLIATIVLLLRRPEERLADRGGIRWWWATKLTPPVAVSCMIAIAWLNGDRAALRIYCGLMIFVAVAVPWKIWRHRHSLFGHEKGPEFPPALS